MELLCLTKDLTLGEYIKSGLKCHNIYIDLWDKHPALENSDSSFIDGILMTTSFLSANDQGCFAPALPADGGELPTFLCVDHFSQQEVHGENFKAVFRRPFLFHKMAAAIKLHLDSKRRRPPSDSLKISDLVLHVSTREAEREGIRVPLSNKEFLLLDFFMRNAGRILSRAEILESVWDRNVNILTNTVDVHVRNLRKKIDMPFVKRLIRTVHCVGYRFG